MTKIYYVTAFIHMNPSLNLIGTLIAHAQSGKHKQFNFGLKVSTYGNSLCFDDLLFMEFRPFSLRNCMIKCCGLSVCA